MRLPVSGLEVGFRAPDGNDDLAILEAAGSAVERALAVLPRLVQAPEMAGDAVESRGRGPWAALTVTDFETALLGLRRFLFGDAVVCVFRDHTHKCGVRMEVEFSIAAFLGGASPRVPSGVRRSEDDPRWFHLPGDAALFRLPTVEDQLQVLDEPRAATLLARRCVKSVRPGTLARAERAMEAMAPLVSRPLAGSCPECGQTVTMPLNVPSLVMDELRAQATGVHEEIHVIAAAYRWTEAAILAMPRSRRRAYAETIRQRDRVAE